MQSYFYLVNSSNIILIDTNKAKAILYKIFNSKHYNSGQLKETHYFIRALARLERLSLSEDSFIPR
jgi:hypothetical protein